jgi:Skp family chaperone for outer membrane proteins
VIVTLTSSESGDWTVDVVVGKKRTVRPVPVAPADVAKVARALPTQVADAVDRALESARRQQQDRVARLEAELAQAQRALKDLG